MNPIVGETWWLRTKAVSLNRDRCWKRFLPNQCDLKYRCPKKLIHTTIVYFNTLYTYFSDSLYVCIMYATLQFCIHMPAGSSKG